MSNTMAENFTDAQNDNKISVRQKKKVTQASLWASALVELRKRKLDQVAFAATKTSCNFCKIIHHMSPSFDPKELEDDQDLTELNFWNPRTKNKMTQFPSLTVNIDVATSTTSVEPELEIPGPFMSKSTFDSFTSIDILEEGIGSIPFVRISSSSDESEGTSLSVPLPSDKEDLNVLNEATVIAPNVTSTDEIVEIDSSKDIKFADIKSTSPKRQSQKTSKEHIEKRKVSILDIKSAAAQKQKRAHRTDSKGRTFTPKRTSGGDIGAHTHVKGEILAIPPARGISKETECQKPMRSSLRSPSLPSHHSLRSSGERMTKTESATMKVFRRMSDRIGETIAQSKIREQEIITHDQKTNELTIKTSPISDLTSAKKTSDIFHRSTKSDGFPRKQISFYGEFSASKIATSRALEDDYRTSALKNMDMIACRRKSFEEEIPKPHILEEAQTIDLCPCSQILEDDNYTQGSCSNTVCLQPQEDEVKKIEDFFEELTRTKKLKMKCFIKVLVKIKHIIKTNLDRATADHQILDVQTYYQNESGSGNC
ncbi:hypothetical protein QE152_g19704 [Popillia japonica]|uniref:Uncharacterized protein n=1 Tax=Popillia japonica TaxID=7064 RepID=A0AAW1KS03_POPJA